MHLLEAVVTYLLKKTFEHDIDSAYGVFINYTFLNFTGDLLNIWQFNNQMTNMTVS